MLSLRSGQRAAASCKHVKQYSVASAIKQTSRDREDDSGTYWSTRSLGYVEEDDVEKPSKECGPAQDVHDLQETERRKDTKVEKESE